VTCACGRPERSDVTHRPLDCRDADWRPVRCVETPDERCREHRSCLTCPAFPPRTAGVRA
jgi:hypothetical protein